MTEHFELPKQKFILTHQAIGGGLKRKKKIATVLAYIEKNYEEKIKNADDQSSADLISVEYKQLCKHVSCTINKFFHFRGELIYKTKRNLDFFIDIEYLN